MAVLLDGLGTKLRSVRKNRNLSLKQLAERIGCSPSYLSMVENGKIDPGISRLKKIVDSLEITIVDLFQSQTNEKVVTRRQERIVAQLSRSKTRIEILIPQFFGNQLDARLAIICPEGSSEGDYKHPGEEFGFVLEGILELVVDGMVYQLTEGDSFHFSSSRDHSFRNPGTEDTKVLWVNHPPSW